MRVLKSKNVYWPNWGSLLRPVLHPKPVLDFYRVAEYSTQVAANFLRTELQCGHVFASIGLSTNDERKRIRNARNARIAYDAVLRYVGRVALHGEQARELTGGIESLKYKLVVLVALEEKQCNIVGRRLADRIHMLAAKAQEFPTNSPASQQIAELMKAELSEYFEREKNPPYGADRRSSQQK